MPGEHFDPLPGSPLRAVRAWQGSEEFAQLSGWAPPLLPHGLHVTAASYQKVPVTRNVQLFHLRGTGFYSQGLMKM